MRSYFRNACVFPVQLIDNPNNLRLFSLQDKLLSLNDEIGDKLEYFQELEQATRMLNHPGESLVLQSDFLYMVERVDICIDYLKAHVSHVPRRSITCSSFSFLKNSIATLP